MLRFKKSRSQSGTKKRIQDRHIELIEYLGIPYYCHYCRCYLTRESFTIDHVIPLNKWGSDNFENTVISCEKCNNEKDSSMEGWTLGCREEQRKLEQIEKTEMENLIKKELKII